MVPQKHKVQDLDQANETEAQTQAKKATHCSYIDKKIKVRVINL